MVVIDPEAVTRIKEAFHTIFFIFNPVTWSIIKSTFVDDKKALPAIAPRRSEERVVYRGLCGAEDLPFLQV